MSKPSPRAYTVASLLVIALTPACNRNLWAPSGQAGGPPASSPAPQAVSSFHISGVVNDEDGQVLPNIQVVINHYEHLEGGYPVTVTRVRTDGTGRYELDIKAVPGSYAKKWIPNIIAWGYAHIDSGEFPNDFQFIGSSTPDIVKNFRLNRFIDLAPGDSATVTFLPDDGVCTWSDFLDTLCRYMRVTVPGEGILTVNAVPLPGVTTPVTFVVLETDDLLPWHGGAGTMNYPVKTGVEFQIAMTMPPGFSQARSYAVTTSFRPYSK